MASQEAVKVAQSEMEAARRFVRFVQATLFECLSQVVGHWAALSAHLCSGRLMMSLAAHRHASGLRAVGLHQLRMNARARKRRRLQRIERIVLTRQQRLQVRS